MTVPTRAHLRQVLLARARMALSALPDQIAAEIVAMPLPRSREAVERRMMEVIEARLAEIEASPPAVTELCETIH